MSAAGRLDAVGRAVELVSLFVSPADFGGIAAVAAERVPEPFRGLLDHDSHMTVAMERWLGGPVALQVVAEAPVVHGRYAREILLTGPGGRVVQFGIVRIDLAAVNGATADRIRAGVEPLGRILLDAGLLCTVGDVALVEIAPGPHLGELIGPRATFGRVATIAVAARPAVELLEIVAGG